MGASPGDAVIGAENLVGVGFRPERVGRPGDAKTLEGIDSKGT
jgi:hypothetical protein